jgi:ubiquitin-like domain-containing CTD phosphatase 1
MFTVTSTKRDGTKIQHHVKPLQIIWTKFPRWNSTNTVHIDDLSRNFALNLSSGLKCKAYYRRKSSARRDSELLGISQYLEKLATSGANFDQVEFANWSEVLRGAAPLVVYKSDHNNSNTNNATSGDEKDNEKKRSGNA